MSKVQKRGCVNPADSFCYICGQFIPKSQKRTINKMTKIAYHKYFDCVVGDQDREWAPHVCCQTCAANLSNWLHGKRSSMPFAVPMIWREPTNHFNDCYFCMTKVSGFSRKNKHNIEYPEIPSATRPVPHGEGLPAPAPPANWEEDLGYDDEGELNSAEKTDATYSPENNEKKGPHLIEQAELNDLVRDLQLSKDHAELLGSRLQQWNLLASGTKVTIFRTRNQELSSFFIMQDKICVCVSPNGVMERLGFQHNPDEWRLFIDSSKISLKAVLLHNGNKRPSIPLAHAVGMKETYESMSQILNSINYDAYKWQICGDLKVIGLLLGLQGGFTKYCCFLCLWDSRATASHYKVKEWPQRDQFIPGQANVKNIPLVDPKKVLLPPLHIKLGLMKNFVKALDKDGDALKYLKQIFPKLSDAKLKEGIFVGPQIRKILKDKKFHQTLSNVELAAWKSFKTIVSEFLGNRKIETYEKLVKELLEHYCKMGCRMSLKIHFLHSHLNFFPENLGAVSDEQGERFHQDILTMEQRYQGRWDPAMMGDYCWFLMRESDQQYKRKSAFAKKLSTKDLV